MKKIKNSLIVNRVLEILLFLSLIIIIIWNVLPIPDSIEYDIQYYFESLLYNGTKNSPLYLSELSFLFFNTTYDSLGIVKFLLYILGLFLGITVLIKIFHLRVKNEKNDYSIVSQNFLLLLLTTASAYLLGIFLGSDSFDSIPFSQDLALSPILNTYLMASIVFGIYFFVWFRKQKNLKRDLLKPVFKKYLYILLSMIVVIISINISFFIKAQSISRELNPGMKELAGKTTYNIYGFKENKNYQWFFAPPIYYYGANDEEELSLKISERVEGIIIKKGEDLPNSFLLRWKGIDNKTKYINGISIGYGEKGSFDEELAMVQKDYVSIFCNVLAGSEISFQERGGKVTKEFVNKNNLKGSYQNDTSSGFFIWSPDEKTDIAIAISLKEDSSLWKEMLQEITTNFVIIEK